MTDLFSYVGAFSNAPTSSKGTVLGGSIAARGHKLRMLYMTTGDQDGIVVGSYASAIEGMLETAGAYINTYYQILIRDGYHNFDVWNNATYNFSRLAFRSAEEANMPVVELTLQSSWS
jgi:hypothetical protein